MKTGPLHGIVAPLIAGILIGAISVAAAAEELREFKNDKGRPLMARAVSHKGDGKVRLETEDGKKYTLAISTFSQPDQVYLNNWVKANPPKIDYELRFEVTDAKLDSSRANLGYKKVRNSVYAYHVNLTNIGRDTVSDIVVEYKIFMTNQADGEFSTYSSGGLHKKEGTVKMPGQLAYNHSREFETESFAIDEVKYGATNRSRYKDSLAGIMIRVLDKSGEVVAEYKSEDKAIRSLDWETAVERKRNTTAPKPVDNGTVVRP